MVILDDMRELGVGSGERGVGNRLNETLILRSISTGVLMVRQAVCQLIGDWQMLGKILGDLTCARNKLRLVYQ
jgi:hypothetical protein